MHSNNIPIINRHFSAYSRYQLLMRIENAESAQMEVTHHVTPRLPGTRRRVVQANLTPAAFTPESVRAPAFSYGRLNRVLQNMPFKPFRPPLIRKPPQAPQSPNREDQPPTKRRRISDESPEEARDDGTKSKDQSLVSAGQQRVKLTKPFRKPLVPVGVSSPANDAVGGDTSETKGDGEAYFNVLW